MAAAPKSQKVLVLGPPAAGLAAYFAKLSQLQTKHSFDLVLAQDCFSGIADDDDELAQLLKGDIKVPVQVYVAQGRATLPEKVKAKVDAGEEVAANLSVLPKAGLLTLASGLRLATLSGGTSSSPVPFTDSDITTLTSGVKPAAPANSSLPAPPQKPVDILLTHLCPSSLPLQSTKPLSRLADRKPEEVFAKELDDVASAARAKYHFVSAPGTFWEREPFVWPAPSGAGAGERSFCRALSLGEVGNKTKERSFYAFSITPSTPPTAPTTYTPSPFHASTTAAVSALAATMNGSHGPRGLKRPVSATDEDVNEMGVPNYIFGGVDGGRREKKGKGGPPPDHYTCHLCEQKGHWIQDCPEKEARDAERQSMRMQRGEGANRAAQKPISPDECWFCLSNPKVTKHLITSIGTEAYVTLPKGQVCSTDQSPVPGGGHVMIIPISHYETLRSIPADLAPPVLEEVALFKQALQTCYKSFGAEMVAWEVARKGGRGGHAHVQLCPIPSSLSSEAESTFTTEASKHGLDLVEITDTSAFYSPAEGDDKAGSDYFKVDLPGGKSFVHWIEPGKPFSLQFGRETVAVLLRTPDRADWKKCTKDVGEEKKDTVRFKKAFEKFDPSLQ
ncbi:hypothetical protein JCM8097_006041 [Rhodosporidiobolus ruineniae]